MSSNLTTKKSKKKKSNGKTQKQRVHLAYVLLTVIIVLITTLILLVPKDEKGSFDAGEDVTVKPPEPVTGESIEPQPVEPTPDVPEDMEGPEQPAEKPVRGKLYLVIDDVGYNLEQLDRFLEIPMPITYAVLPMVEHTAGSRKKIGEYGGQIILHQPIEPLGNEDPGPGALYVDMEPEEIQSTIAENLEQIPEAVGVNNHMGSLGTSDYTLMESMLREMKKRNPHMFFLDSRTTADTVAEDVAKELQLYHVHRHIFLDNSSCRDDIIEALDEALTVADEQGYAVMIGHVWCEELAAILPLWYAEMKEDGYRFDYISGHFSEGVVRAGNGN